MKLYEMSMKLYEMSMKLYEMGMKMIWELYENRYLIEICNNGKIYISNIELFFEMLVNCY